MIQPESSFAGLTVNERLVVAGLVEQWDAAIAGRRADAAIDLLRRVGLDGQGATIVDAVLANPSKYGFPAPK
jgi:hypothetical protein